MMTANCIDGCGCDECPFDPIETLYNVYDYYCPFNVNVKVDKRCGDAF